MPTFMHTFKDGKGGLKTKELTPLKAIRAKCLDCSGGSAQEVRKCPVKTCPLWPFRSCSVTRDLAQILSQNTASKASNLSI